jgi:hypothetical protein
MHEWRSDIAQLACALFLLLEGPGPSSVDALFSSAGPDAPAITYRAVQVKPPANH